ncbi:phosphoadenosine phosphosulfate reductase family protein [Paremcibacter congregatus]|uniref:phosphoadenosine phosphosulfate reductase domain-containing protein n=1 Tax=Paremcibacter congregatus TaxID=2043170 RepID=UPI003A930B65
MMKSPYWIDGPAVISFSGGRSSAFMLHQIIRAHGGTLPDDAKVIFCNTGKERPETLDFVQECASRWGVHITWLEWRDKSVFCAAFEVVSHNSAARNGEPFSALVRKRRLLPNPATRFCTGEMKVKTIERYCKQVLDWSDWSNVVGLRADERHRVAKMRRRNDSGKDAWETVLPMAEAEVTKRTVSGFWQRQPFDLGLPNIKGSTPAGNCDLCFMKGFPTLMGLIRENPESADWWVEQEAALTDLVEKTSGAVFRCDRPAYGKMKQLSQDQGDFGFEADEGLPCMCTD